MRENSEAAKGEPCYSEGQLYCTARLTCETLFSQGRAGGMGLGYWWRRCRWSLPLRRPHSSRTLASDYPPHHAGSPGCYVAQVSAEVFQPTGCPGGCLSVNLMTWRVAHSPPVVRVNRPSDA